MNKALSVKKISQSLIDQMLEMKGDDKGRVSGDDVIDLLLKAVGPIIGERIRERRDFLRMSQADLAAALDISQSEIAKIEKGTRAISTETSMILAKALKTSPEWILTGK